jgi:hypothetical protein
MDPVTLIVAALATGAAAGLKDTAASAIKDAYGALKGWLSRHYGGVNVDDLERKPESNAKRASLAEDLADAGAGEDEALLDLARHLVAAVRENDPQAGHVVGVDLDDVAAEFIRVGKITSTGTGFRGKRLVVDGGLVIGDVDAGGRTGSEDP